MGFLLAHVQTIVGSLNTVYQNVGLSIEQRSSDHGDILATIGPELENSVETIRSLVGAIARLESQGRACEFSLGPDNLDAFEGLY